jgi:hypothetical protein
VDVLVWLLDQSKLLRLLADLIFIRAKEARGLCYRPLAVSFVRSLISVSDQGSPEFASIQPRRVTTPSLPGCQIPGRMQSA